MSDGEETTTCICWGDKLEELLNDKMLQSYISVKKVSNRHEAWFIVSAVSNIALIEEIKALREELALWRTDTKDAKMKKKKRPKL